jgi:hypothetical protein
MQLASRKKRQQNWQPNYDKPYFRQPRSRCKYELNNRWKASCPGKGKLTTSRHQKIGASLFQPGPLARADVGHRPLLVSFQHTKRRTWAQAICRIFNMWHGPMNDLHEYYWISSSGSKDENARRPTAIQESSE